VCFYGSRCRIFVSRYLFSATTAVAASTEYAADDEQWLTETWQQLT